MGNESSAAKKGKPKSGCLGCHKEIQPRDGRYRKCAFLDCSAVYCGECKGTMMFKRNKGTYFCGEHHFAMEGDEGNGAPAPSVSQLNPAAMAPPRQPPSARASATKRGKPPTPALTPGSQDLFRTNGYGGSAKRTDTSQTPKTLGQGGTAGAPPQSHQPAAYGNDPYYQQQQQPPQQPQEMYYGKPNAVPHGQFVPPVHPQMMQQQQQQQQQMPMPMQQQMGQPQPQQMGVGMQPEFLGASRKTKRGAASRKATDLINQEKEAASPNTAATAHEAARSVAMMMSQSQSQSQYSIGTNGTASINSVDLLNKMLETRADSGLMIHGDLETNNDGNSIRPRYWTDDEDEKLRKAVSEYGAKHWKTIATFVPGRTHVQCLQRWNKVLKPGLRKGPWTDEEDKTLTELVNKMGDDINWSEISDNITGRSAKQCRERWSFNLDPKINKGDWTKAEDETLLKAQQEVGNKWSQIAVMLPGRTENAIKTRFKSIIRARKREWRPSEDALLLKYHEDLGNRWEEIAARLPTRTKNAVKMRFKFLTEEHPEESQKTPQQAAKEEQKRKADAEKEKSRKDIIRTGASQSAKAQAGSAEARSRARIAAAAAVAAAEAAAAEAASQGGAPMPMQPGQVPLQPMYPPGAAAPAAVAGYQGFPMHGQPMMQGQPAMAMHAPQMVPQAHQQDFGAVHAPPGMYQQQAEQQQQSAPQQQHHQHAGPYEATIQPNFTPQFMQQGGPNSAGLGMGTGFSANSNNNNNGQQPSFNSFNALSISSLSRSSRSKQDTGKIILSEMLDDLANMEFQEGEGNGNSKPPSTRAAGAGLQETGDSFLLPNSDSFSHGMIPSPAAFAAATDSRQRQQRSGRGDSARNLLGGNSYSSAFDDLNLEDDVPT